MNIRRKDPEMLLTNLQYTMRSAVLVFAVFTHASRVVQVQPFSLWRGSGNYAFMRRLQFWVSQPAHVETYCRTALKWAG
jgi:hypothetical protein